MNFKLNNMENLNFLDPIRVVARNSRQQLKLVMQLPVRISTGDKTVDFLPLVTPRGPGVENSLTQRRFILDGEPFINASPNEMIVFFHQCELDSLLTPGEVAKHYGFNKSKVRKLAEIGFLIRYRLTNDLTLYKRAELPTLEQLLAMCSPCMN